MNILVTGGNGQLGCSIRKISRDYPRHVFTFTDIPEADITDRECIEGLIKNHNTDVIINCAAYTSVDMAESNAAAAEKINTAGPEILARIAKDNNIKLIHISTDYVFDGESCHPLKEDHPACPTGVYGKTKLNGERAVEASGCDGVVVRTAWLYSEFGNNFLKTMLRLGKERKNLDVVYDQVGSPTYARDLSKAIIAIAERGIKGFDIYHYSNEGVCSWYDFAVFIFYLTGMSVKVGAIESDAYPTTAKRPAYSVLAKDKIKSIGVDVPYWAESLAECLKVLKENDQL